MPVVNTKLQSAGPGYYATSSSSVTIGTGSQSFTTQTNLAYSPGAPVIITSSATPTNYMLGYVTSYSGTSLVADIISTNGSGTTYASWFINVGPLTSPTPYTVLNPGIVTLSNGANNNVSIGNFSYAEFSGPTSAFSVSGFTGGVGGRFLMVWNNSGQAMTFKETTGSTSGNQIFTNTGADVTITGSNGSATFLYDANYSWWILMSHQP